MSAPTHNRDTQRSVPTLLDTVRTLRYRVTADDSVRALAPRRGAEFARKPDVMASARLVELCEQPCMEAIREHIAENLCSLGMSQYLDHRGPITTHAQLTLTARCTHATRRRSRWDVAIHDGHEHVGYGEFGFVVVDPTEFHDRRCAPKTITR